MTPIEVTTGGENPTSGGTEVRVWVWTGAQEKFLSDVVGQKIFNGEDIKKVNEASHEAALTGQDMKISGRWVNQLFLAPDGVIFIIQGNRKANFRDPGSPARLIVRTREQAALREVNFETMRLSISSRSDISPFKGRFDVLTPAQAAGYGFLMNPQNRDYYDQGSIIKQFSTRILEQELQPVASQRQVQGHGGETVVIQERRRTI